MKVVSRIHGNELLFLSRGRQVKSECSKFIPGTRTILETVTQRSDDKLN